MELRKFHNMEDKTNESSTDPFRFPYHVSCITLSGRITNTNKKHSPPSLILHFIE